MNYKKIFITSALMSLMSFLPGISFSQPVQDNNTTTGSFYVSGKYVPSVSHFGDFSAKEEKHPTVKSFGLKKDGPTSNFSIADFNVQDYSYKYENNPLLGFSGSIGYSMEGPRVELEISYETFDVKNQGNSYKNDAHMYYALARQTTTTTTTTTVTDNQYVYIKNEGLNEVSFMINACYDIITEGMPFAPYICAGIGTDLISMFDVTNPKISYQGKLGISYAITPEASVFIGGHYHRVMGSQFKNIPTIKPPSSNITDNNYAIVTLNVCHFGIEMGGRIMF